MIKRRSLLLAAPALIAAPRIARAWLVQPTPVPTSDPYYANVVLLMHMDQANGSLSPVDQKGHVMTSAATIPITTAQFKFGSGSANQTSLGGAITTPDSADWEFGTGQFTVEAWIRNTTAPTTFTSVLAHWGVAPERGWFFGFNGNQLIFLYSSTGSDAPVGAQGVYVPTLNGWDYIAATRDISNLITVRANGALIGSNTNAAAFWNANAPLYIGNDSTNGRGFLGQIDEVRITKGIARNISIVPTAPFFNS